MALPTLVLLFALLAWGIAALAAQVRCVDAARSAARAVARGERDDRAVAIALAAAPAGAQVRVSHARDVVTVAVTAWVGPSPGWRGHVAAAEVHAEAAAEPEPGLVR